MSNTEEQDVLRLEISELCSSVLQMLTNTHRRARTRKGESNKSILVPKLCNSLKSISKSYFERQ